MRADPDGPSTLRETSIRIVLDRLVTVEFRPASTRTPSMLDGIARQAVHVPDVEVAGRVMDRSA